MRGEFSVRWKFKGVRTPPETKHGPWLLGIVRSHSRARRMGCDSSTVSQGKAKEDEDVESLESGESLHDTSASSVKEFGNLGSTPSVHTHRFGSGTSAQTSSHASSSLGEFRNTSKMLSVHTHRSASGTSTQTTLSHVSSSYNHASPNSE